MSLEFRGKVQTGYTNLEVVDIEMIVKAIELKEITKNKCKQRIEEVQRLENLKFNVRGERR